jgi:hypothetical protein
MTKRQFAADARDRGWTVVNRRGLVLAVREDRTVVAEPAVGVAYSARLLDEPKPGTLIVW